MFLLLRRGRFSSETAERALLFQVCTVSFPASVLCKSGAGGKKVHAVSPLNNAGESTPSTAISHSISPGRRQTSLLAGRFFCESAKCVRKCMSYNRKVGKANSCEVPFSRTTKSISNLDFSLTHSGSERKDIRYTMHTFFHQLVY